MYLNSNSDKSLFESSCKKAFSFLNRKELENIKYIYKSGHNTEARKYIKEKFGIDIFLPTEYTVSLKNEDIFISDFHSFNEQQDLLKYILDEDYKLYSPLVFIAMAIIIVKDKFF